MPSPARSTSDASHANAPPDVFPSAPPAECDLVMKGGITSGIVYPAAILRLAQTYRFRAIGGASAGAIAAATTAAAELGRQTRPDDTGAGFYGLQRLLDELKQKGFIASLFEPSSRARALFTTVKEVKQQLDAGDATQSTAGASSPRKQRPTWRKALDFAQIAESALGKSAKDVIGRWEARGLLAALVVYVVVVGPLLVARVYVGALAADAHGQGVGAGANFMVALPALFALALFPLGHRLGRMVGAVVRLVQGDAAYINSRESFFGICTGHAEPGATSEPLTDWLSERLTALAGCKPGDPPLTFGDLHKHGITFQLVTTNLSKAQPAVMPWKDRSFLFKENEFRRLFPDAIVDYLIQKSDERVKDRTRRAPLKLPAGYHHFPAGLDLPVIVATRMSLSFPVLLSAVPLYTLHEGAYNAAREAKKAGDAAYAVKPGDIAEHWFSDGGIANNFPIHFFDAWIPTRPTFGISLGDSPIGSPPKPPSKENLDREDVVRSTLHEDLSGEVLMLRAKAAGDIKRLLPWHRIKGLAGFMGALLDTARNYRDNTQSVLPSYRERVAMVFLDAKTEGGLNLDMPPATIERILRKGERAADLIEQFDFKEHKWVRSLVLLSRLEAELNRVRLGPQGQRRSVDELRKNFRDVVSAMEASCAPGKEPFYRAIGGPVDAPSGPATLGVAAGSEGQTTSTEQRNRERIEQAVKRMDAVFALMEAWERYEEEWRELRADEARYGDGSECYTFFLRDRPLPDASLRVTPEL